MRRLKTKMGINELAPAKSTNITNKQTDADALSIAAAETTLGRPLTTDERARLEALKNMLKDRENLEKLLNGTRTSEKAALPESKESSDQELERLINKHNEVYTQVTKMITSQIAKGLADLIVALADTRENKLRFRECGELALTDLTEELKRFVTKHWFTKHLKSSKAAETIRRLETQLTLLKSLWEDETCQFERINVEPIIHEQNTSSLTTAINLAELVVRARIVAKTKLLELVGDILPEFRELVAKYQAAYEAANDQIESMKKENGREKDNNFQQHAQKIQNPLLKQRLAFFEQVSKTTDIADIVETLLKDTHLGFRLIFQSYCYKDEPGETRRWPLLLFEQKGVSTTSNRVVIELCKNVDKI